METNRTEISELGEFKLIDHLTKNNETRQASTLLSIGDDAAVLDHLGKQIVVSTDMLIEGIHFDLHYTPLKHLGYKSIAVNLSDICAMMATPVQVTVSIAISNRFSVEALEEFYEGIYAACNSYNVDLIGGDTTTSQKGFIISVTAIGEVKENQFVSRKGAQKGDLICVSGNLGSAYLGLQLLEREKKVFLETKDVAPDLENKAHIVGKLLKPEARLDVVQQLEELGIRPSSMIDISDGLSSEILHICNQSEKGCVLYEDKLPIHDEAREMAYKFQIDPTMCALNGGEDYELLFTIPQDMYEHAKKLNDISVIGYITDPSEKCFLHTKGGNRHELIAQGWNPI